GDDNSSRFYSPNSLINLVRESIGVNVVIIGVGNLDTEPILKSICSVSDNGKYIHARDGVGDAITTAFEEVSTMLTAVEVEGFIPDF
ncbi:MAG: hypothetical protein OEY49_14530, partial [Candidatus Heimdallarchaeota archaeon]|nr:hypothetical protein [Candidatus Heimdallarchaeota archaeon]